MSDQNAKPQVRYELLEQVFSSDAVLGALGEWINAQNRNDAPAVVPLPPGEDSGRFNKRRNLKRGGKYGEIANACGVSFDVLLRWYEGKAKPRPEQIRLICSALIRNGRLRDEDAKPICKVSLVPIRSHSSLLDQLTELSMAAARWP